MTDYNTLSRQIRSLKQEINRGFKTGNVKQKSNQHMLSRLKSQARGMTEAVRYERDRRSAVYNAAQVMLDSPV